MPPVGSSNSSTPQDEAPIGFYWRLVLKPNLRHALIILSLIIVASVLQMVTIGLAVPLLNVVTDPAKAATSMTVGAIVQFLRAVGLKDTTPAIMFTLLVVAAVLFVLGSAVTLLHTYATATVAHRLRLKMKSALFATYLGARFEVFTRKSCGVIVHDINTPPESIYVTIQTLGMLVSALLNGILLLALMFYLSWWATLVIAVFGVGGVQGWRRLLQRRSAIYGKEVFDLRQGQSKLEVESIDGVRTVKAYGLEPHLIARQRELLAAEERPTLRLVLLRDGSAVVNEFVASVMFLGLGAVAFLAPQAGLDFSALAGLLIALRRVIPSLGSINAARIDLNKSRVGLEVLEDILHGTPSERLGGKASDRVDTIMLQDLSFRYESQPGDLVLNGVTLTLARGSVTAIVAPTGAGKSTIANLLVGLYEPVGGRILVNHVDLRELDVQGWRRRIGYVSQDVFLFNASLKENITLWRPVSDDELQRAAEIAQLDEVVTNLPEGYRTIVGDRGVRLSGGQCQRVAIARAVLRQPDVLILDEATNALDNLTERAVYAAIDALRPRTIVVVISHRLSTIKDADQIVVLERGRVVETGGHDALMRRRGLYSRMYGSDRALALE